MTARGFGALPVGQRFEPCYDVAGAARYCAKLAAELAHGWAKQLDGQGADALIGIFTIACRAMAGDREAERLFLEYAAAMAGAQQGRVSKSLRDALKLTNAEAFELGVADDRREETVGCQARDEYVLLYARSKLPDLVAVIERECPLEVGIHGWARVIEWIDATLRAPRAPPRPVRRISAEEAAAQVRAHRAAFTGASTAELLGRVIDGYRSRSGAGSHVVAPEPEAVLVKIAAW